MTIRNDWALLRLFPSLGSGQSSPGPGRGPGGTQPAVSIAGDVICDRVTGHDQ